MIHIRDIRRAIEGLHDDCVATAAFSFKSDDAAFCRFDLNLEEINRKDTPHGPQVVVEVRVTETEDDEKKEEDYADEFEFNPPPSGWVGGHFAAEQDYNANALIPGAEPCVVDPRD